jgi:hypothetical protein
MKKLALLFLLTLFAIIAKAQDAGYDFPKPKGWNTEKLNIPIDFAKDIPYSGTEELRFTPGWGDAKNTSQYWGYDFLWYVEGVQSLRKKDLDKYMTSYYNGLYLSNLKGKPTSTGKFTKADIKKADIQQLNDKETYTGTVSTLDFLTGQPINFNLKIHVRQYAPLNHTAIIFEVSPQDYTNMVWDRLDGVANGFSVKKK